MARLLAHLRRQRRRILLVLTLLLSRIGWVHRRLYKPARAMAQHGIICLVGCVCVWCLCLIMFANRADVLLTRRPSTPTDDRTPKAEPALSGSISISQAGSQAVCSALSFHPFSGNGPNIEKVTTD